MQKKVIWAIGYFGLLTVAAIAYRMTFVWIVGVLVLSSIYIPVIWKNKQKQQMEYARFLAVSEYMEQMLYAFQTNGKILQSLEEVLELTADQQLHQVLEESIQIIQYSISGKNVYEEALKHIEHAYPNERLSAIHRFMIQVETYGGEYRSYTELLLQDRAFWVEQVMLLYKQVQGMHLKVCIAIGLTSFMCGVAVRLLPMEMTGIFEILANLVSVGFLLLNLLIYTASTKRSAISWLERDAAIEEEQIKKYIKRMEQKQKWKMGYHLAVKQLSKAVDIAFPHWLMEMALLLQRNNVQMAIRQTRRYAPAVMEQALIDMDHRFELEPDTIEPYAQFLQEYDKPDIQQAMKMLYAVSKNGQEEIQSQIAVLLKRNQKMVDQAEKIKNDNVLAGMMVLYLVPMLTGACKLMLDMTMFLITFMGQLHF